MLCAPELAVEGLGKGSEAGSSEQSSPPVWCVLRSAIQGEGFRVGVQEAEHLSSAEGGGWSAWDNQSGVWPARSITTSGQ